MKNDSGNYLIGYAIMIPPIMFFAFFVISKILKNPWGYFVPYAIYLCLLAVGILLFEKGKRVEVKKTKSRWLYYGLCFVPVFATLFIAFLPVVPNISIQFFLIVSIYACANGSLEELFWRGTFSKVYSDDLLKAYIIPTIVFTCWHFSLLFAKNISFRGGAPVLVGGACVMGFIWGLAMFKTKNMKVVLAAHILVNICAFSQLLFENSLL